MTSTSENKSSTRYEGPFAAIIASILGVVAWLVFILLYALFWSKGFNLFENVIVTIVSLAITGLLIGAMWMFWIRSTSERRGRWPN
jgi:high-affinity Fe2+/Pb2+ permease